MIVERQGRFRFGLYVSNHIWRCPTFDHFDFDLEMSEKKPPSASERKACWAARDAYFECLNLNHLWIQGLAPSSYEEMVAVDPLHLSPLPDNYSNRKLYACRALKKIFDSDCLASWV